MILVFLFIAKSIVGANVFTNALYSTSFEKISMSHYALSTVQNNSMKSWMRRLDISLEINIGVAIKCKIHISQQRM